MDPAFPQGVRQFPGGGRQHTILPKFSENCMKLKEFGRPRAHPPPGPPMVHRGMRDSQRARGEQSGFVHSSQIGQLTTTRRCFCH